MAICVETFCSEMISRVRFTVEALDHSEFKLKYLKNFCNGKCPTKTHHSLVADSEQHLGWVLYLSAW